MVSVEPDRQLVCEALAQLSAADRGVLCRSYYQGWTTAQIAHDLHIPEGTVKMKLHYTVRALQRRLQEMGFRTRQPSSRIGP
jgi:RNA polymerase sigma-70 factor (ECF subfamily)